ncbi:hypothetical protein AB3S75_030786 [Citrus x aurantiifolia]
MKGGAQTKTKPRRQTRCRRRCWNALINMCQLLKKACNVRYPRNERRSTDEDKTTSPDTLQKEMLECIN